MSDKQTEMQQEEQQKLHDLYLGLGTNLGNKAENISHAVRILGEKLGEVIAVSSLYETKPVGFVSENDFINAACYIKTTFDPFRVLEITQQIEKEMGRKTKSAGHTYSDRIIDIDILMFDDLIINSDELVLPHPHLHERGFVLFPLYDIAKEQFHPLLEKTIAEIKNEYEEKSL